MSTFGLYEITYNLGIWILSVSLCLPNSCQGLVDFGAAGVVLPELELAPLTSLTIPIWHVSLYSNPYTKQNNTKTLCFCKLSKYIIFQYNKNNLQFIFSRKKIYVPKQPIINSISMLLFFSTKVQKLHFFPYCHFICQKILFICLVVPCTFACYPFSSAAEQQHQFTNKTDLQIVFVDVLHFNRLRAIAPLYFLSCQSVTIHKNMHLSIFYFMYSAHQFIALTYITLHLSNQNNLNIFSIIKIVTAIFFKIVLA